MSNPKNIEGHKWAKGQSGNPKGRPKEAKNATTILREMFVKIIEKELVLKSIKSPETQRYINLWCNNKNMTVSEAIFLIQILKAVKGDARAAELLMKYNIELPKTNIDIQSGGDKLAPPPWLTTISNDEEKNDVPDNGSDH